MNSYWWWSSGAEANDSGVDIGQSLRFRGTTSWLQKTNFATTPSSTFTMSMWVKLSRADQLRYLYGFGNQALLYQGAQFWVYQTTADRLLATDANSVYRDPSAWYHICVSNTPGTYNFWINGELQRTINRTVTPANDIRIGDWSGQSGVGSCGVYFSDVYWIEGQTLQPEAFGRENDNGVWVPREVDFTPAEMRYSDFLTPTVPGTWDDGNAANVFDGLTTTFAGTGTNGTWTFAPTTDIEVGTQVRVFALNTAGTISWNGQTATPNGGWVTLTASGVINADTPLVGTTVGAGQSSFVNAIEVDGEILVNPFLWSAGLFTSPNANTPNYNTTERTFASAAPATNGFDGNATTQTGTNYPPAEGGNAGTWLIFRPTTEIVARNSIVIRTFFNGEITVNETDTGISNPSGTTSDVDISAGVTFPVTIQSIGLRGNAPGTTNASEARFFQIFIDGQPLVDGANHSYGANGFRLQFADPDDLGHDSSGNQNDLTPSAGFNTNRVGIFSSQLAGSGTTYESNPANRTATLVSPNQAFDGNLVGQCQVSSGSAAWIYWNPTITCNTVTLIVNNDTDQLPGSARINGVNVAIPTETLVGSNFEVEFPVADGELTEFAFANRGGPNTSIFGMRVNNGAVLVDNNGVDYDLMQDSPTENYATLNPLGFNNGFLNANITPTHANLGYTMSSNADIASTFFVPTAGLYYFEFQSGSTETGFRIYAPASDNTGANGVGISADLLNQSTRYITQGNGPLAPTGQVAKTGSTNMQIAIDAVNRRIYVGDGEANNWWRNNAGTYTVGAFDATQPTIDYSGLDDNARNNMQMGFYGGSSGSLNFGQQPFVMTIPAGWDADDRLQTQNLPGATIADGRDHFQAITGPGTGANGTVVSGQRGGDWSKDVYGSASTTYDPDTTEKQWLGPPDASVLRGPWRMFDGDLVDKACKTGTGNAQTWIYWRPDPAIENVTQLTIHTSNAATVRINGGAPTGQTSSGSASTYPIEIASPPATLTSVAIQGNSISSATVMGITINNEVLIENSILTQAQNTFDTGLWWIKARQTDANTNEYQLVDSVRGANTAFQCPNSRTANYIAPAGNSVAWCWNLLNTPADNGFNIIEYTGNSNAGGTNTQNVAHNLGGTPDFFITFRAGDTVNARTPWVWHGSAPAARQRLQLNDSTAGSTLTNFWGQPTPTDLVFGPGDNTNANGFDYLVYAWRAVPNYSAFGSYQGNSDANGPVIVTGFRPAFILTKRSSADEDWSIVDTTRSPNNPAFQNLRPNQTNGEGGGIGSNDIDILSNGFKLRNSTDRFNGNSTYVYACFAENPFGSSNTSPANAR